MLKIVKVILFILASFQAISQEQTWKLNEAIADSFMQVGIYYDAVDYYNKVLEEASFPLLHYKLADAYKQSRNYEESAKHFSKVMNEAPNQFPEARFYYALMEKHQGNYEKAIEEFDFLKHHYEGPHESYIKKTSKLHLSGCELALNEKDEDRKVKVIRLSDDINKGQSDFGAFEIDNDLLFTSFRTDSLIPYQENKYNARIYKSTILGPGEYTSPVLYDKVKVKFDEHIANGTMSPSGGMFVYSVCKKDKHGIIKCQLYYNTIDAFDNSWSESRPLPDYINTPNYTTTQASFGTNEDGQEVLYYTSDRPGGRGGMDIWYCKIKDNGTFDYAKNCGSKINTRHDEICPFYIHNEMTLCFSSNGHIGFGGYDIFEAGGTMRSFEEPHNVGYPINSSYDDLYYFKSDKHGFFSSNRPSPNNHINPNCCDDIYYFGRNKSNRLFVGGLIDFDHLVNVDSFSVSIYTIDLKEHSEALVKFKNIQVDDKYNFQIRPDRFYRIKVFWEDEQNYYVGWDNFNTININKSQLLIHNIKVEHYVFNTNYIIKDVNFESDSYEIKPEFYSDLDKLVSFMQHNPELRLELGSHTDNVGDEDENIKLSQKRADAIKDYLIKYGIKADKISSKGYGSSIPKADNKTAKGRNMNRRCEFKIIGKTN